MNKNILVEIIKHRVDYPVGLAPIALSTPHGIVKYWTKKKRKRLIPGLIPINQVLKKKHLAGRHDQKKHSGSITPYSDYERGGAHKKHHDTDWTEHNLKGSFDDFLQDLSQYGDVMFAEPGGAAIKLPSSQYSLIVNSPLGVLTLSLADVEESMRNGYGLTDATSLDFDNLSDAAVDELYTIEQGVEKACKKVGVTEFRGFSDCLPVQLAAELGFTVEDLDEWATDDPDWDYQDTNTYPRPIDYLAYKAQEYLEDKYNLNSTRLFRPIWRDRQTVKELLDIKHPNHPEVSLFTEYLSRPAEVVNNHETITFYKTL